MSKRRSDWESRPQARVRRWFYKGFLALDDEIAEKISNPPPPRFDYEEALEAQQAAIDSRQHERSIAIERLDQHNLLVWMRTRGRKAISRLYVALALVNIVAGMILDYRAFDTLGESTVLFIAASAVLILLRIDHDKEGNPAQELIAAESDDRHYEPRDDRILQGSAMVLTPIILLYGIYIILNGHLSPGGGFSGGAIVSAGLILYLVAFGFEKAGRFFTTKTFTWVSFFSLSFYALAKAYAFYMGANGLPSGIPLGTPGAILSSGLIMPLNIAVGMVVACTMYVFYALFRKGGL